jgi:hypothetical protein
MLFLRRLGLSLSIVLLTLSLLAFAATLTVYKVLDTPPSLKNALSTSGVYDVLVQNTINDQAKQSTSDLSTGNASQDEAIRQALKDAFPPAVVQQTTEQSLDQAYDWLHGKTPSLVLSPDLSGPKNAFANRIEAYVQTQAATLPACTAPMPAPTTLDELLRVTCLPNGVSPQMAADNARQLALESKVFDSLSLNTSEIKDDRGRPLSERLKNVPEWHNRYVQSLYVLPLLALVCCTAIFFWSATRRGGVKKIGHILLWTGISSILWAALAAVGLNALSASAARSSEGSASTQNSILNAAHAVTADLREWWIGIGVAYVLLGIGLLVTVRVLGKRTTRKAEALNQSLGYAAVPRAGTTFDPDKKLHTPTEKPATKTSKAPGKTAEGSSDEHKKLD